MVRKHPDSPWKRVEPSDEDSLQVLKDGLRRTYQERGYARAKVDVTFETTADEELVAFAIEKGERWSISSVNVTGAASLRPKDVYGALQMRPRGLLEPGRYVDGDAAADRDALEARYRANGFRYARVSPPVVTEGASRDTLDVTFVVEEGLRTIVATRTVAGIKTVPEATLLPKLAVKSGLPYSESAVSDDAALLQSLYVDRGYVDAKVESSVRFREPGAAGGRARGGDVHRDRGFARDLRQDDSARQPAHEAFHRGGSPREQGGLAFLPHEAP